MSDVTQADREAAANYFYDRPELAQRCRDGMVDGRLGLPFAFARHRIQSTEELENTNSSLVMEIAEMTGQAAALRAQLAESEAREKVLVDMLEKTVTMRDEYWHDEACELLADHKLREKDKEPTP